MVDDGEFCRCCTPGCQGRRLRGREQRSGWALGLDWCRSGFPVGAAFLLSPLAALPPSGETRSRQGRAACMLFLLFPRAAAFLGAYIRLPRPTVPSSQWGAPVLTRARTGVVAALPWRAHGSVRLILRVCAGDGRRSSRLYRGGVLRPLLHTYLFVMILRRAPRCVRDSLRLALSDQLRTGTDKGNPTV